MVILILIIYVNNSFFSKDALNKAAETFLTLKKNLFQINA